MTSERTPVIGILCDTFSRKGYTDRPFHGVAEEYIHAVQAGTGCVPLLIPAAFSTDESVKALLGHLDGLLLTGSDSNVHPSHYQETPAAEGTLFDLKRDSTTFALIEAALEKQLPILGICRGFQELNVALGGTLHQQLFQENAPLDHGKHLKMDLPQREQYQDAHEITLCQGGYLERLLGTQRIRVNSLHHQGVKQLAPQVVLEAEADDGVIEAFRLNDDSRFLMAVQWHPEWHIDRDPVSRALFNAFAAAVRDYAGTQGSCKR